MNKKHLDLNDRITIQSLLQQGCSLARIASELGFSRSTISREIKAHRKLVRTSLRNSCAHCSSCTKSVPCSEHCPRYKFKCQFSCGGCNDLCPDYLEVFCPKYERPPYVCNPCTTRLKCTLRRMLYDARHAQEQYETLLSESRKGISLSEQELMDLNEFVTPKLRAGLSVPMICDTFKDRVQLSDTTLYSYINSGLLEARNIDLRRKLSRPERKKSGPVLRIDKKCHIGRTFDDYRSYIERNPDASVVQMDSVILQKGGQALLTLFFTNCDLQLMFLRSRNTAASVSEIFSDLRSLLGYERFSSMFHLLLTDRGSEFTNPSDIECFIPGHGPLCHVFFCDPLRSNQKAGCERNHEFIRYVIPKKHARESYTDDEIRLMMNHINSYPRKKWNGQAPVDMFISIYGPEAATLLGLEKIPSDSIILTPALFK